jgi:hypothetical protein
MAAIGGGRERDYSRHRGERSSPGRTRLSGSAGRSPWVYHETCLWRSLPLAHGEAGHQRATATTGRGSEHGVSSRERLHDRLECGGESSLGVRKRHFAATCGTDRHRAYLSWFTAPTGLQAFALARQAIRSGARLSGAEQVLINELHRGRIRGYQTSCSSWLVRFGVVRRLYVIPTAGIAGDGQLYPRLAASMRPKRDAKAR